MKKFLAALAAGIACTFAFVAPALASGQVPVSADCLTGWYVNDDGDENTRKPAQAEDGLVFKDNQLVHHAPEQNITLNNLNPGTFVATPAPSLLSFFSVEIANPDGSAYATLRYDPAEGKWHIGGPHPGSYTGHEANPIEFIGKVDNWGTIAQDAHVISFGVGYVAHPATGTETTVSSVTFAGETYDLTCEPEPQATSTATATATPSVTVTATAGTGGGSASPSPAAASGGGGSLPVTGSPVATVASVGVVGLLVGGVLLFVAARRRRKEFVAE